MEVTDELKEYSYRTIYDDCIKEKKFIAKDIRFFLYCTVCLSVTCLFYTSEEGNNLPECDNKEESLKFHFFNMFSNFVVLIQKYNIFKQFSAFLVLLQLHL